MECLNLQSIHGDPQWSKNQIMARIELVLECRVAAINHDVYETELQARKK